MAQESKHITNVMPLCRSYTPVYFVLPNNSCYSVNRERRALIKCSVRKLFAERGYGNINVRDLAQVCRVSPQTLYNNFGGRDEVLTVSMNELLDIQILHAKKKADLSGSSFVMVCCDQIIELLKTDFNYMESIYRTLNDASGGGKVGENLRSGLVGHFASALQTVKESGGIKSWVDPGKMAKNLVDSIYAVLKPSWHEQVDILELSEQLKLGVGLPMLGASIGKEVQKIEESF
jgi:AcrR family transcriptional regulator